MRRRGAIMTSEDEKHQRVMGIADELLQAMYADKREDKAPSGVTEEEWQQFQVRFAAFEIKIEPVSLRRGDHPRVGKVLAVHWQNPTGPFRIYYDTTKQRWYDYPPYDGER